MVCRSVLVPLDGSRVAEAALTWAADLTRGGGTVILLRAADDAIRPNGDPVVAVRRAAEYLEEVTAHVRMLGVDDVAASVWYGSPAEVIVKAARVRSADVIVMATQGGSGSGGDGDGVGRVAASVMRSTATPILLVRGGAM